MKYLSLFSGIGGFELGIKLAYVETTKRSQERGSQEDSQEDKEKRLQSEEGKDTTTPTRQSSEHARNELDEGQPTCVGFSEIDKYATQIYQEHFPNHKNYGDITKINEQELPDFDLLVGGFPCQAFSIAGKRGGFNDTRGTLFFEIARIIKQKQPRLLVLENVKGLLSHDKGNTFTTIISTLDELGYDLQWQVLNSKNHGVPQNRERVFIIGHLRGTSRPEVFPFGGTDEEDTREVVNPLKDKTNYGWHFEQNVYSPEGLTRTVKAGGGSGNMPKVMQLNQPKHSNDRVYGTDGVSPTLNTMQGGNRQPFIPEDSKIRRLTPTECERLQGFPDGWTKCGIELIDKEHFDEVAIKRGGLSGIVFGDKVSVLNEISDTQRYKTLGNAVTVNVIKDIFEKIYATSNN